MPHTTFQLLYRLGLWARTAILLLLSTTAAHAGQAFFAGRLEDGRFVRDENIKDSCYMVRYSTVTATVDENSAMIRLLETVS